MIVVGRAHHKYEYGLVLHALVELNDGGSVVTACRGRWSVIDAYEVWAREDKPGGRPCEECNRVEAELETPTLAQIDKAKAYSRMQLAIADFRARLKFYSPLDVDAFERWISSVRNPQQENS